MMSTKIDKTGKKKAMPNRVTQAAFYGFLIKSAEKTQTGIARELGVSISLVNKVVLGERRNKKIIDYILGLQSQDRSIDIIFN